MKILTVRTQLKKYRIFIGYNIIENSGTFLKENNISESIFIISSPKIYKLHGRKLQTALRNANIDDIGYALFNDTEENKSYQTYINLIGKLIEFDRGKEKRITVIAFGGGVVGDVAGFVAGTYKRGIPLVQIPTTLLSMVDSSIGGKTGIDFSWKNKTIKNILGEFYQPDLVLIDLSFLKTLPEKAIIQGIAEIIKYGIISDLELFEYLEKTTQEIISSIDRKIFMQLIFRAVNIKRKIVQQDERETKGIRTVLNYGHTIGHAIEAATNFNYSHGEAISIGMICEAEISNRLGLLKKADVRRIENLIKKFHLPTKITGCKISKLIEILRYDKKFHSGKNLFVLPVKIGKVILKSDIDEEIIYSVLTDFYKSF